LKKIVTIFLISNLLRICILFATEQPFDAIINLGRDCQIAYQMHTNGIREYALPFDKLITQFDSLCKLLENKFDGFMECASSNGSH
jgi:hypothetical protein